jgi:hypothetical protein
VRDTGALQRLSQEVDFIAGVGHRWRSPEVLSMSSHKILANPIGANGLLASLATIASVHLKHSFRKLRRISQLGKVTNLPRWVCRVRVSLSLARLQHVPAALDSLDGWPVEWVKLQVLPFMVG